MQIDIIVDTVCPWCYVGKARFEKALRSRSIENLLIGWRPFQLNPNMPRAGKDRDSYLIEKFGSVQRAERAYRSLQKAGEKEGVDFRFDRIDRTPNTVDSHRLITFAGRSGLQNVIVDALFRGYFSLGRDIGDSETLSDIAAENGLDRAETLDYLASDLDRDTILAEDDMVRDLGVNGVPCYIIDRKYAISGAQTPEVFLQVLDLASHDGAAQIPGVTN
ncbi:MAG: DsbA family oxidoreductase [Rhodospirillales bacterium]|nr:DsbA family oxidoreductase [Rhodospirillales bacterium]